MPNFLKSLFKKPQKRSKRDAQLQTRPTELESPDPSPSPSPQIGLPKKDIEILADLLHRELQAGNGRDPQDLLYVLAQPDVDTQATLRRLLEVLQDTRSRDEEEVGTPLPLGPELVRSAMEDAASRWRKGTRGKGVRRIEVGSGGGDVHSELARVIEACVAAITLARQVHASETGKKGPNEELSARLISLLEAQREKLFDLRAYGEGRGVPTLLTLKDIYVKLHSELQDTRGKEAEEAEETLATLVQVAQEGPDYLIVVTIIEAIIWQAEIIDPNFGADLRNVLDEAVAEQADLTTFRRAAESIIAISSALPPHALDDREGRDAYNAIGVLVKQLHVRVVSSRPATPSSSRRPAAAAIDRTGSGANPVAVLPSPVPRRSTPPAISPTSSPSNSPIPSPNPNFLNYDSAADLQARYGTGPLPGLSSARPPQRRSSPSNMSEESEPEIWEYRGHHLTRSALSLVRRQELLAFADSSGQYAGEVSWDDWRNAWIPNWAEKLRPGEVAEGELGDTNPAEYKVKRKDAWGNKIGWMDGRMFYHEEPVFELRE